MPVYPCKLWTSCWGNCSSRIVYWKKMLKSCEEAGNQDFVAGRWKGLLKRSGKSPSKGKPEAIRLNGDSSGPIPLQPVECLRLGKEPSMQNYSSKFRALCVLVGVFTLLCFITREISSPHKSSIRIHKTHMKTGRQPTIIDFYARNWKEMHPLFWVLLLSVVV